MQLSRYLGCATVFRDNGVALEDTSYARLASRDEKVAEHRQPHVAGTDECDSGHWDTLGASRRIQPLHARNRRGGSSLSVDSSPNEVSKGDANHHCDHPDRYGVLHIDRPLSPGRLIFGIFMLRGDWPGFLEESDVLQQFGEPFVVELPVIDGLTFGRLAAGFRDQCLGLTKRLSGSGSALHR